LTSTLFNDFPIATPEKVNGYYPRKKTVFKKKF